MTRVKSLKYQVEQGKGKYIHREHHKAHKRANHGHKATQLNIRRRLEKIREKELYETY